MEIRYTKDYLRTLKRITRKHVLSSETIDSAIELYLSDKYDKRL